MKSLNTITASAAGLAVSLLVATTGSGQQKVPFEKGIPVAPQGLAKRPLPANLGEYDTAEAKKSREVALTRARDNSCSLVFLPDGSMLVTKRPGSLRIIRNGVVIYPPTDRTASLESLQRFKDDVREVALDCGHFIVEEKPEETAEALLSFMGGQA